MKMLNNISIIQQLIYKDWYLNRKLIAIYLGGAIFALSVISLGEWQFVLGCVLFTTMIVALGNHQISITLINERKEHTLPFIMSLPISPKDYALAKLGSNLAIYIIPWTLLTISTAFVILATPIPDGFLPFAMLVCGLILLNHCITWGVGMATESEGAILIVMIGLNCLLNLMIFALARLPDMNNYFKNETVVWNFTSVNLVVAELVAIVVVLSLSVYLQTRKKVFY